MTIARSMDSRLLPGSLVTGSPQHGTGAYLYAICAEQPPGSYGRQHLAVNVTPDDGMCTTIGGLHFAGWAPLLWGPA